MNIDTKTGFSQINWLSREGSFSVGKIHTEQPERNGKGQEGRKVKVNIADTINGCLFNLFKAGFWLRVL